MKKLLLSASMAALLAAMPSIAYAQDDDQRRDRDGRSWDRGDDDDDYDDRRRGRAERDDDDDDGRRNRRSARADRDDDDDDDDNRRNWRGDDRNGNAWARAQRRFAQDRRQAARRDYRDDRREDRDRARDERRYRDAAYRDDSYDDYRRSGGSGLNGLIGQILPAALLGGYNVPSSYRSFYPDSQNYSYRYDDGNIFRIDRGSNVISSLIPLLGGGFGVGQLLPSGYDVYNVPTQYRDTYRDSDEAYYRYGDNAIYQVDPQSQMIESVVALLAGDTLGIGQALPGNYDAYNVPLDYRDQYYDNDQSIYRYADGNIYQADAKTQIIQAVISALV